VFWQGRAHVSDLLSLTARFLGAETARRQFDAYAARAGASHPAPLVADAQLVQFVETLLGGAIGSASARVMVSSVVEEEDLGLEDVLRILEEASQLRAHSQALEAKSRSLERATAELRAANEQLQSLDRLKDDFMSSVTHELRTPLTSIRALSELMRDDAHMDLTRRQQFLDIIVAEAERLSRLVNQVLDLAKIESGHADWHQRWVDIGEVVAQAVHSMQESYREAGVALHLQRPEQVFPLQVDADRITQVVLNLLSNALKYAPRGSGRVVVSLHDTPQAVQVEVVDNGPGIPVQAQGLVFEKFRQVSGDAHYRPGGTGLGLPLSRQIVEHFGGRMWLRSAPGQGSTFGFSLPRPIPSAEPQPDPTPQETPQ
jgi:signal transduction histidine kinase